jgi:hypothetical protein
MCYMSPEEGVASKDGTMGDPTLTGLDTSGGRVLRAIRTDNRFARLPISLQEAATN